MLSLNQFFLDATKKAKNSPQLRFGQATFNLLADVRKDLADRLRGTDEDPYECKGTNDPRWWKFVGWLGANWSPESNQEK